MRLLSFLLFYIFAIIAPVFAQENGIYIWQRNWQSEVLESIDRLKPLCNSFIVLGGDFQLKDKRVESSKVLVNWDYLKSKGPVTVAFRVHKGIDRVLKNDDISSFVDYVAKSINDVLSDASQKGVQIAGVQIDYDCPTSKLSDFTRFVKELKENYIRLPISITALPTWMNSFDFPQLISAVDYYVLQLHSFEIPKSNDKAQYIFPKDKAPAYFQRAISLNRPFYLSLPTYGYEVAYANDGRFLGLRAEGGVEFFGNNIKQRLMYANSNELLKFISLIKNYPFKNFLGINWFRLPVKSDKFNWDIKTLECVIKGQTPKVEFTIKVVDGKDSVKELYLLNSGETNVEHEIGFNINWQSKNKPIYDILSDFTYKEQVNHNGIRVSGKAPMVDQSKFIGWFRTTQADNLNILTSEVMINEKS
jgi:Protein of unknown function (DUF3142)